MKKLFQQICGVLSNLIFALENTDKPISYFILTFLSVISLRNFLEVFVYQANSYLTDYAVFLNLYLFYFALVIAVLILFYAATRLKITKIARVVLPCFAIVALAPILDALFSSGGKKYVLTYLLPYMHGNLFMQYLTFGRDFSGIGITPGVRIEIAIILAAAFLYLRIKGLTFLKSIFFTFLLYSLLFLFAITPCITKWAADILGIPQLAAVENGQLMGNYYFLLVILAEGAGLSYIMHREVVRVIAANLRLTRIVHYGLMFVLGIALAFKTSGDGQGLSLEGPLLAPGVFKRLIFMPILILLGSVFSMITNDLEDFKIDKISNQGRPLVSGSLSPEAYKRIARFILFIILPCAILVDLTTFIVIVLSMGGYFLYSMPPLRLKRVPFFSKLVISFNSLLLVWYGFITIRGPLAQLPPLLVLFFLIGLTGAANFIDLKDYAGDKAAGIKTLPVILGEKKAKLVIGIFFVLCYCSVMLWLAKLWIALILAVLAALQFYLLNRKRYQERYVFCTHLLSIQALIIYLLIGYGG
jgi:4-hydroxybenzoate polyprenyltransferase